MTTRKNPPKQSHLRSHSDPEIDLGEATADTTDTASEVDEVSEPMADVDVFNTDTPPIAITLPPTQPPQHYKAETVEAESVVILTGEKYQEYQHLKQLRYTYVRTLRVLEEQRAGLGGKYYAPPHVITGIEDTQATITAIDEQLSHFSHHPTQQLVKNIPGLSVVKQRELLEIIADRLGISFEDLSLIEIIIGSIIFVIDMPFAAAALLQAMFEIEHPALAGPEIQDVNIAHINDELRATVDREKIYLKAERSQEQSKDIKLLEEALRVTRDQNIKRHIIDRLYQTHFARQEQGDFEGTREDRATVSITFSDDIYDTMMPLLEE